MTIVWAPWATPTRGFDLELYPCCCQIRQRALGWCMLVPYISAIQCTASFSHACKLQQLQQGAAVCVELYSLKSEHLGFLVPPLSRDDLLRFARADVNASGPPASRSVPPP